MLFNSLHFFVLLPVVLGVCFALPTSIARRLWLITASLYFYAVLSLPYTGLLLASVVANWWACRTKGDMAGSCVLR